MDTNDWNGENRRRESIERWRQQIEYEVFTASPTMKKTSMVLAGLLIVAVVALILVLLGKGIWELIHL